MEADPYQTTRELAVTQGMSQSTVVRGLESIGKVRKLGRWVPHASKQYDMDMALPLLTLKRTPRGSSI
nr:SETMAR [Haemonchus contortus]CDJ95217.1 histone-lysine N-methyltransferase SETMAR [Haemonchus contortus]